MLAWRHLFWGLTEAMARAPVPWAGGAVLPNPDYAAAYRVFATVAYPRIKEIIENAVASGLIYIQHTPWTFRRPNCAHTWTSTCAVPTAPRR